MIPIVDNDMPVYLDKEKELDFIDLEAGSISDSSSSTTLCLPVKAKLSRCGLDTTGRISYPVQPQSRSERPLESTLVLFLPAKAAGRLYRNLRWTLMTPYRRLVSAALVLNLTTIVCLFGMPSWRRDRLNFGNAITATSINLTISVIMRQEYVVNLLVSCAFSVIIRIG